MGEMSKAEAREAMIKKRFGGNNNGASGGSGNARRKKKSAAKVSGADDKKVSTHLKKLNPQVIPGIEEVNIFTDNGAQEQAHHGMFQEAQVKLLRVRHILKCALDITYSKFCKFS